MPSAEILARRIFLAYEAKLPSLWLYWHSQSTPVIDRFCSKDPVTAIDIRHYS
jgi:hypothetical protein